MLNKFSQNGQSLIEMVIVIAVGVLVASALVFATIASLRNSQFAKNQSIATKLAQDGIETIRGIRDRDGECRYSYDVGGQVQFTEKFSELYNLELDPQYKFQLSGVTLIPLGVTAQPINQIFYRQVQITDSPTTFRQEKVVIVRVKWSDFSGEHQSQISTILTKK